MPHFHPLSHNESFAQKKICREYNLIELFTLIPHKNQTSTSLFPFNITFILPQQNSHTSDRTSIQPENLAKLSSTYPQASPSHNPHSPSTIKPMIHNITSLNTLSWNTTQSHHCKSRLRVPSFTIKMAISKSLNHHENTRVSLHPSSQSPLLRQHL